MYRFFFLVAPPLFVIRVGTWRPEILRKAILTDDRRVYNENEVVMKKPGEGG